MPTVASGALWIFGYGSLIWRPGMPYAESHDAYVEGYARRFFQGSTDHRGVPGAPGRVATLVPDEGGRVVGRVFRVTDDAKQEVLERLDRREQNGYERKELSVYAWPNGSVITSQRDAGPVGQALVYLAGERNPHWLGPASDEEMAGTIARAVGPTGPNREYLVRLAAALHEMNAVDEHVRTLERLVAEHPAPTAAVGATEQVRNEA